MPAHGAGELSMQELSKYFSMPEKTVAKQLGICLTSLKKICRQNGINRWPYRKIKSLDKKLRKLDAAMTHAKDDVSMLHAVNYGASGSARWSETRDHPGFLGADSPFLCPTDESNAVTPRYSATSPSSSGSLTPAHLWGQAPFPSARSRPAAGPKGGVGKATAWGRAEENLSALEEGATSVVKTETQNEMKELSDDELIAMLAECAAKPAGNCHENFAQVLSERMSAVAEELQQMQQSDSETSLEDDGPGMAPGDEVLMAALANCCGGHSPFEGQPGDFDTIEAKGAGGEQARGNDLPSPSQEASGEESSLWFDDDAPQLLWQH